MRRFLRAYPTLLRVGLAEAIAYRAEFLVWMLSMTMPLVMLALMRTVAAEQPMGRFGPRGFVAYYLATLVVRQMTGSWVTWELMREIREGTLSMRLLRPIHPLAQHSADSLSALPLRAVVSLPAALAWLLSSARSELTHDPVIVAVFIASLAGAWLLSFCISAIIGTLGLYIENAVAVWELWLGCFMLLSGYLLPLELMPRWLAGAARVTPFPYLQALPVELLTGLHSRASALRGLGIQWLWAAGAFFGMLWLWRRATARFQAFGG